LIPVRVAALDTHIVTHIACGPTHTVAVTEAGALASWGGAEFGQLGFEGGGLVDGVQPRIVKGLRDLHFARVAAGAAHTLALTGSGDVYSFGQCVFGALGHGNLDGCSTPTLVEGLWGLGVTQVACGETHSVALTVDGQVRRKRALVFEPHTQLPNLLRGSSLICPMFEKDVPNVTVLYTRANGYDDVIL